MEFDDHYTFGGIAWRLRREQLQEEMCFETELNEGETTLLTSDELPDGYWDYFRNLLRSIISSNPVPDTKAIFHELNTNLPTLIKKAHEYGEKPSREVTDRAIQIMKEELSIHESLNEAMDPAQGAKIIWTALQLAYTTFKAALTGIGSGDVLKKFGISVFFTAAEASTICTTMSIAIHVILILAAIGLGKIFYAVLGPIVKPLENIIRAGLAWPFRKWRYTPFLINRPDKINPGEISGNDSYKMNFINALITKAGESKGFQLLRFAELVEIMNPSKPLIGVKKMPNHTPFYFKGFAKVRKTDQYFLFITPDYGVMRGKDRFVSLEHLDDIEDMNGNPIEKWYE